MSMVVNMGRVKLKVRSYAQVLEEAMELLQWEPEEIDRLAKPDPEKVAKGDEARLVLRSWLVKRLVDEYLDYGFQGVVVYGRQGSGKSTYTFKVAFSIYRALGYKVAYEDIVKRYTFFMVMELIRLLRRASWRNRYPALVWDDAGVEGSSYLYHINKTAAKAVSDIIKTIRTRTGAILMSTPSPSDLLRPLRMYEIIGVHVVKIDKQYSEAHGYTFHLTPKGEIIVAKKFEDEFVRRIPNYEEYANIRDRYVDYSLEELEKALSSRDVEEYMEYIKLAVTAAKRKELVPEAKAILRAVMAKLGIPLEPEDVEVELIDNTAGNTG